MKDVIVLLENTTREEVKELDSDLPTDVHLIEYTKGQELYLDAVRAYRKVDIFDTYHDKLSALAEEGEISNFQIHSITSGHGKHKPKLWQGL